jgi:hypothetical protein
MSTFLYIRAQVAPANPSRASLLNTLAEVATGSPAPDIIPHTEPGAISFEHVRLEAADEEEAYDRGYELLPPPEPGSVMNDYVIALT